MRKAVPELIQNRETMRVNISPVVNMASREPVGVVRPFKRIAGAEDDECVVNRRKRKEIDFIFSNEHPRDWWIQLCKGLPARCCIFVVSRTRKRTRAGFSRKP